jgi:hypothetical protein
MSAPKISAMENEPRNLTIGTLIRVARALGNRVEIRFVRRKGIKRGGGEKSKPAAFNTEGCGTRRSGAGAILSKEHYTLGDTFCQGRSVDRTEEKDAEKDNAEATQS